MGRAELDDAAAPNGHYYYNYSIVEQGLHIAVFGGSG